MTDATTPTGLFVGLATVDVIQLVQAPPAPDEKVTAIDQVVAAGGPATNAAVAFAALGGRALLAAPVGTGALAELVRADLAACGVRLLDCSAARPDAGPARGGLSVSSCTVTATTGERSVASTNARLPATDAPLEELAARSCHRGGPDVVLVDGHYPRLARTALDLAERTGARTVMDAGSWKPDAADLPGRCQVVAPSARFHPPRPATWPGAASALTEPADVAAWLRGAGASAVVLTRGSAPVLWWCGADCGAVTPPEVPVVDTLGAGDVFHGALAHALARRPLASRELTAAVQQACQIAAGSTTALGTRAWIRAPGAGGAESYPV